jgi:hypothetical protein
VSRNALLLSIIYLAFHAYPAIFEGVHHFNDQMTGLAFLGMGVGISLHSHCRISRLSRSPTHHGPSLSQPVRHHPSCRLPCTLIPVSSGLLLARTTSPLDCIHHRLLFDSGIYFVFTSTFTIAALAMASNSALRSTFAVAFPLFAGAMYDRLETMGAMALLASLTKIMALLP